MSDGENFSRGPSFVYKNHESVSYTISTGGGGSGRGNIEVTYDALRKRIAELEAERIIKPLVWEETLADRGDGTWEHDGGYESVTPFGVYAIYFDYLKGMWLVYGLDGGSLADPLNSPSTAKLTAEADYDARITAALEGKKDE